MSTIKALLMSSCRVHITDASSSPDLSVFSRAQRENLDLNHELEMLKAHKSSLVAEHTLKGVQVSSLKDKHTPRQEECESLNRKISSVQDQCCKFEKTKEDISIRIMCLTKMIFEYKSAELDKITNIKIHLQDLQQGLEENISSPECRERLVMSLAAQRKELEADSINLDRELQCAEDAQQRSATTVDNDGSATPHKFDVALKVFRDGRASLQRTVAALTKRKQLLEDQLESLSRQG